MLCCVTWYVHHSAFIFWLKQIKKNSNEMSQEEENVGPCRTAKLLMALFRAKTSMSASDMALMFQTLPELHLRQTPSSCGRHLTVPMKPRQLHFTSVHLLYNNVLCVISF